MTTSPMGRALRRVDPAGPLLALVAGVVYALNGFGHFLSRDLALYAYAGQQVADGVLPYLGVVNRSGPLSHLGPGLGALLGRAVGVDDLLAMRVLFLVLSALCVWLTYLVGRDLLSSRPAGIAMAATLLSVDAFTQYASGGPREKTTMVLLLLAALLALVRHRFGTAGVLVSLATLTWQPVFFVGFVTAMVAVWALRRGTRLRALARFLVGGLVPLVICLVWYAAAGHLQAFLDCFVLIHVQYTEQPGLSADPGFVLAEMREAYGVSLWVLVGGLVVLLASSVRILLDTESRRDPSRRLLVAHAAGAVVGLLWSVRVFNGWPDAFFVLPMCVLGVGELTRLLVVRLPRVAAVGLVVAWGLVATAGALHFSLTTRSDVLDDQRASVDAVFDQLPADATIASVEAPQPLVLEGLTNPTQHQMFSLGLQDYVDATWPGGLEGFGSSLAADAPTMIALGTITPDWLVPVLNARYVAVGETDGLSWHVREDVGPRVIADLVVAVGDVERGTTNPLDTESD